MAHTAHQEAERRAGTSHEKEGNNKSNTNSTFYSKPSRVSRLLLYYLLLKTYDGLSTSHVRAVWSTRFIKRSPIREGKEKAKSLSRPLSTALAEVFF